MTAPGTTPTSRPWHVDPTSLRAWVAGSTNAVVSASIEQHLMTCRQCQDVVAGEVSATTLDAAWAAVADQVEAPRPSWMQRSLVRLGVDPDDAYLIAMAPSLRAAWVYGLTVVLLFATLAAAYGGSPRSMALFLLVAPLAPVAGVACAYGPEIDPSHELAVAAPYSKARLVLLRAAAVMAACIPFTLLMGVVLPIPTLIATAWLLPGVGFVAILLAVGTWFDPTYVAVGIALAWSTAVGYALYEENTDLLFSPSLLVAYGLVIVVGAAVFATRTNNAVNVWRIP